MTDGIKDLSNLTSIPYNNILKITELLCNIISHEVVQAHKNFQDTCEINIGIGTLALYFNDENIFYKFIPSTQLEKNIIQAVDNKDVFIEALEASVREKIINSYKDLF